MAELINRQNYEAYLIDYMDGTLSPELRSEVEDFLRRNPDIGQELDALTDMQLSPADTRFEAKEQLRRRPEAELDHMPELDYLCIAEIEGIIAPDDAQRLQQLAQQSREAASAQRAYALTKLQADPKVVFAHKDRLKQSRQPVAMRWLWTAAAAAAAAVLLVGVLTAPHNGQQPLGPQLAEHQQPQPNTPSAESTVQPPAPVVAQHVEAKPNTTSQRSEARPSTQPKPQPKPQPAANPLPYEDSPAPIQHIAAQEVVLPPYIEPSSPSHIALAHNTAPQLAEHTENPANNGISRVAQMGIYRLSRALGLKSAVRRDASNNITHVRITGQHLAVTIPIKR